MTDNNERIESAIREMLHQPATKAKIDQGQAAFEDLLTLSVEARRASNARDMTRNLSCALACASLANALSPEDAGLVLALAMKHLAAMVVMRETNSEASRN